jgi:DNA gyrase subunit B
MDKDAALNEPSENNPTNVYGLRTEHIRKRPGMYIGGSGSASLHGLADELVSFSIDEVLSGHGKSIDVRINADGSLTVADDGRGIPVEMHPQIQLTILELVMTVRGTHTGVNWFPSGERISGALRSLHGIGARAITALSDWSEAIVCCNGRIYRQQYERGRPVGDVCDIGAAGTQSGTKITFHPDPEIFHDVTSAWDRLEARLRELAFLNKRLPITLRDDRSGKEVVFRYDGGIADFILYLNRSKQALHKPIYIDNTVRGVKVEVALQYTTGEEERVRCYANNAYNSGGGTHLKGFRTALTRTLSTYGSNVNLLTNDSRPIGVDFRAGLTAVISVQVPEPMFESQNKLRLGNREVQSIVAKVVREALEAFLDENPKDAQRIIRKATSAAKARLAKTHGNQQGSE